VRLAAFAAGLVLAGAASAAEAPTRVDLVVVGRLAQIDRAPQYLLPPEDRGISHHSAAWLFDADVEQVLGGEYPYNTVRVITARQAWRPTGREATVYWLKRERGHLYRLVCDQALLTSGPGTTAQALQPSWRTSPNCGPPGERFYEPGS
jgi:hypothetical protein